MIERVLLAVEDSPAGMAAARIAVELAAAERARLRVLHVVADGELAALFRSIGPQVPGWQPASTGRGAGRGGAGGYREVERRRADAGSTVLDHVAGLARAAGVPVEPVQEFGEPGRCIVAQARDWPADLIVLGRSNQRGPGQPFLGHQMQHVLEFAEQPVLVVPSPPHPCSP